MFSKKDPIKKKLEEIAKFLNEHRVDCGVSRCESVHHGGLTYKCIHSPSMKCITCLACEVENVISNLKVGYVCGSSAYIDGEWKKVSDKEYKEIPELSEEDRMKFRDMLFELKELLEEEMKERIEYFNKLVIDRVKL